MQRAVVSWQTMCLISLLPVSPLPLLADNGWAYFQHFWGCASFCFHNGGLNMGIWLTITAVLLALGALAVSDNIARKKGQ